MRFSQNFLGFLYMAGSAATVIYLTFFDGYVYNWFNWMIAVPVNLFMGSIWPVYWGLLRWVV